LRKGVGGEREQRLISGGLQSEERAKTLVQRLLAFARRQPLQATAVDVAGIVAGMTDLIESTTGPQIRVMVDIANGLPAKADPNQLEMALLNLAVNAREAMPGGGTLRISSGPEQVGPGHRSKLKGGRSRFAACPEYLSSGRNCNGDHTAFFLLDLPWREI
jgi:signal transduction histidine kinase